MSRRTWLVIAAGDDRQHGGNDGYDDNPSEWYSWDSTVANHAKLHVGHGIAVWDKRQLLGVSVIDHITTWQTSKERRRCADCGSTKLKSRTSTTPVWRCYGCRSEFDVPDIEVVHVKSYRSQHGSSWIDCRNTLGAQELRTLCVHPASIQSLRELDERTFRAALQRNGVSPS